MKQRKNILRGWPWLVLLALFAWLLPQKAAAAPYYVEDPDNYEVALGGSNVVYFTAPVYDQDGLDMWIHNGKLTVSVDGGTPYTIFSWSSAETKISDGATSLNCNFSTGTDGFFDITLGNSRNTFRLTKDNGGAKSLARNSDGRTFEFSAEWSVPYNLLGKKLKFIWEVERDGTSRTVTTVSGLKTKEISMPAASAKLEPFVSLPMLSANNPGKLEVPWFLASDSIVSAHYEYTDDTGKRHEHKIEKVKSSSILLDANVPYRNFRVVCSYKEASDKGSYLIENQGSAVQNIPVIHTPVGLTARQLDGQDLKVEVKWNIVYPDDEDLTPTDFFEVQRSITGEEKDFVTIQQLPYISVSKQSTYTFVDNTLMDDITPDMLVNGGTLDKLTYRVRRTITKDWNWAKNTCSSTKCVVDNLHLLRIANYSADWEDKNAYTVRVSWNYADEHGAVWDERAQMVLRVAMKNRDGQPVDTQVYTLDQNDRAQCYKIISLSRSCVNYDIEMYVEQGESPLNYIIPTTENGYFNIKSYEDWVTFRDMVQAAKGEKDVNARLYADIETGINIGWEADRPYRGTFDGNGHTVKTWIDNSSADFAALFRYAKDYTIQNLHVTGTVKGGIHSAGLVGHSDASEGGRNTIQNCRVSVNVESAKTHAGGIVGHGLEAAHTITDCLFDGSIKCSSGNSAGAIIGWSNKNDGDMVTNCLEKGTYTNIKNLGMNFTLGVGAWGNGDHGSNNWTSHNWAEANQVGAMSADELAGKLGGNWVTDNGKVVPKTTTITNVTDYFFAIHTAQDWTTFRNKVEAAKGQYDVNARLYADVNAGTIMVGWEQEYSYRGIFDGNGHTLTFSVNDHQRDNVAPFVWVGNATIKNLHVAGNITSSKKFIGGLIGQVLPNANATVENCRSSVTINSSVNGDATNGGFVCVLNSNATVMFRNCKFDGSFVGTNCSHNGGYVGYANGPVNIENCLFAPASINTKSEGSETWARVGIGSLNVINSYATREFSSTVLISNADDWTTFRNKVEEAKGQYDVNAILTADISSNTSAGDEAYPYRGTFDGNGHTLTINISHNSSCQAPFRYASNATFRNLRTAGTLTVGGMFNGGLIGEVIAGSTVNIENCHSSMTINCSLSGDGTNGGFIGHIMVTDAKVTFRNCKFDGSFEGANSSCNGGFVGWSSSPITFVNCLFTPASVKTDPYDSDTWARGGNYTTSNCYATKEFCHLINNSSDWEEFRNAVSNRGSKSVNAILNADISVNAGVSTFKGLFDGNAHTLNISGGPVFGNAVDYTIKNLHVTGSIGGDQHIAGLVGGSGGSGRNYIESCWVSVGIHCNTTHAGGFIGHANTTPININNCLFDGAISCKNDGKNDGTSYAGSFIGWSGDADHHVTNCLDDGGFYYVDHQGFCWTNWNYWGNTGNSSNNYTYKNWPEVHTSGIRHNNVNYVVEKLGSGWYVDGNNALPKMTRRTTWNNVGSLSANDLAKNLGPEWKVDGNKVVPVMGSSMTGATEAEFAPYFTFGWTKEGDKLVPETTTVEEPVYAEITKPTLPNFYHKNTGTIDKTLVTTTRQSSVLLAWNTDGNPIDYFTVMRRVKGQGDDAWKEIATFLDDMSYEDTSVSPLATYEYKVLGVNDCEGRDSTATEVKVGECKHTGRVDGYVRFNDGTSAAGIQVDINYKGKKVMSVFTDDSGHFVADELSYQGGTSVTYDVSAEGKNGEDFSPKGFSVTFDAHSNDETLREISILNGKRFSGYVMYDGTSIPVKGANFKVNGKKVYNTKGKLLETEYDGSFSFRVLPGNDTIQVVMDGHNFTNDGYFKGATGHNFTDDVAGIYFYDATKVKLAGRVVGGEEQGQKPLGNNLSTNNLGDSLTIVLTLEGDNTSWLVYDNLNPNKTEREEVVRHQRNGQKHFTSVKTQRKRMTVWPDPTTGEYELLLPPVRWKVQQVYCTGYPTLFQEGQVSEVIDLTDCLTPNTTTYTGSYKDVDTITVKDPKLTYNAIYNRIYRAPVEVTYKQLGYDSFDYFGDKNYYASELTGETVEVPLAFPNPADTTKAIYSFTYPVFSIDRKYTIELQVGENYLYNNDPAGKVDIVRLGGGMAMMQNGMKPGSYDEPVMIDSLGRARFTVQASQTTNMKKSLKTVTFTVMRDGTFLEAKPLQGYVLNMFPVGESTELLTDGQPLLFDILRDPPGSYSSNTLAKGATLNYSYMMNLTLMAGIMITYKDGKKLQTLSATVVAPQGSGTAVGPISAGETQEGSIDQFIYTAQGSKAFSYTMAIGNNISTSGDPSMVGADADLYIGAVQNVVVTPMSTVRAVNKKMFDEIAGRQGGINKASEMTKDIDYGTVVKIAEGVDAKGDSIYLIRDVALGYGPKIQSQFIYSQKQILTQIIPNKAKEIVDMMFCGTKDEAQAIADRTGKPVYWSLREPTDSAFAVVNKQLKLTGHAYNDYIDKAEPGINYMVVIPNGTSPDQFNDEVTEKYQIIKAWTEMIAQNEFEKLQASDRLTNYDIAGAQGVNYSETFDSNFSNSWTHHFPVATEVDYFGPGISYATSAFSIGATIVGSILASMEEMKYWKSPGVATSKVDISKDDGWNASLDFAGKLSQWTITPVALYQTVGANSEAKAFNRTESFTIATDPMSRLSVDVYRVKPLYEYDKSGSLVHNMINPRYIANDSVGVTNIFTNYQFEKMTDLVTDFVGKEAREDGLTGPRGFVFRTRGGATQNPWEDQRTTKFYETGRELDARTLKIVNPKIRLDKQDVSGVSINDAAHFKVYVSNESEKPEATEGLTVLQLFSVDQTNTNGAKISVNGQTLTTGGMTISVVPGSETELDMEVRAGQGFDFMGLTIGVMSPTDAVNTKELVSFNVHYLHEAGGLAIAVPGDKWVLNTNAQMDSKRGWYLPVTINGFDRHQHNFDHIEFQYKESQRGDDSWTNICSFYADPTLMANANGVRELIPENGNIVTQFYGEGWVMEREYDLRAVLFCRNGSDFLTTSSKIISGVKDTRRPQLFGTPEPKNGLLTQGDDIVFNFSEDIEYNYLSAITNFEVKGEVNNDNVSENVSVQFAGKASVETEAKRNFSGKDLTIDLMVKPAKTGRDMPLFSHGTNGQKLQLWLTKDYKLKAVVNDQTFTSDSTIVKSGFTQVAMTVNQQDSTVTFFNGGVQCGKPHKLNSLYNGTGTLIFGRTNENDRSASTYYEGKMMEARLWYAAMDGGLIGTTYGSRRLTGYEKNLVDYYPMNEGSGKYAADYTQGANAMLMGADWAIPHGLSLQLKKADKGVLLDKNAINRTSEQDYTLMFWFKTDADGRGTLLSNGRGLKEDNGGENLFHIGFEGDKLLYRSNGFAAEVPGNWSDGQWHNFAMTVNRARNVANIYMDKELRTTFEADSLGGISGGYPLIGATRYDVVKENGDVEVKDGDDALKGNVDELLFFAQALPQQLINTYATKSPNGDEAGLLTYLSFDRQERQKDNSIELVPYAYSKKLYLDDKGEPRYQLDPMTKEPTDTLVRDYLFVDEMDVVMKHFDAGTAAPVVPYEEVKNLKFSFIGKGNQVLVELDEPAAKLNHCNIYVTLRDIEDKNGNTMASPQTACYFVSNSSLEWLANRLNYTIKYGSGEALELPFYNYSASSHTFTIENCPKWLALDKYSDVVAPLGMDAVTATVSKDLNIGTYNEIIYLTDEEGITEPFYLNLTVEGEQPDWAKSVPSNLLENSMNISGQVYLFDELDTDSRDIVGVFDEKNVCHGFANISHSAQTGETELYLTVYDDEANGRELKFRLWQYSTGREIVLIPEDTIRFEKSAVLGTDKPVRFDGSNNFIQYFNLEKGWNWVSFNVSSKQLNKMNSLLTSVPWKDGDIVTDMSSNLTLTYQDNEWLSSKKATDEPISSKKAYAIKVQEACTIPVEGAVIKDEDERTIELHEGWNGIGYTPAMNLSVETALTDYYDQAEEGDVIKSRTEFAYFTKSGNTGRWRGSLQYMKPGEGYMMLRKSASDASFTYPYYEPNGTNLENAATSVMRKAVAQAPNTMSVSAIVEGFETEAGDVLVAYANGEAVGEAVVLNGSTLETRIATEPTEPIYLSITGDAQQPIWFAIERDGEIVASTGEIMTFKTNAVIGSPDEPTAIDFTQTEYEDGKWYTISGLQLQQKPTEKGVYIYNGKKVLVK